MGEVTYHTFQAFKPHFDALARVGYFKLIPKSESALKNNFHVAYRAIMWLIVLTYNLQHVIRVVQVRHSSDQIVNILFILLTTLNTLGKQLAFNLRKHRIDNIIDKISGPVFAPQKPYHEEVMKSNGVVMHHLLRLYHAAIFICALLWTIFPLVNRALGFPVEFTGYFPFDTHKSPTFELVVAYMNIFIAVQAYGNVTMDCTIVAFYAQVKVQLQILRYNLEHLFDEEHVHYGVGDERNLKKRILKEEMGYKDSDESFKRLLKRRFVQCVARHRLVKWFINEIESVFAEALLFQFLVFTWVICMTVYKIVGLSLLSAEFVSMAMYLCCMLAQLYIYCYYGTQVKYESEFVNQSLYCGNWLCISPGFRRQLLIMMENCKRPITPRTAYIIPITLETYISRQVTRKYKHVAVSGPKTLTIPVGVIGL